MKRKVLIIGLLLLVAAAAGQHHYRKYKKRHRPPSPYNWSIGIVAGSDPLNVRVIDAFPNPRFTADAIPGHRYSFVADPFLIEEGGEWFLFFEMFDREARRGEIGVATSPDAVHWTYAGPALQEPFHLSYPFVFEEGTNFFMIPESRAAREVRLYRAVEFPLKWELDRVLFKGNYSDPTPVAWQGKWWIFATRGSYSMDIWYADDLRGEWRPHAKNPLYLYSKGRARNGGRPLVMGDKIFRFAQDSHGGYGRALRALVINELDPTRFVEHVVKSADPLFSAHGDGWARVGMHHYSPVFTREGSWIAAVDGSGIWEADLEALDQVRGNEEIHSSDP